MSERRSQLKTGKCKIQKCRHSANVLHLRSLRFALDKTDQFSCIEIMQTPLQATKAANRNPFGTSLAARFLLPAALLLLPVFRNLP